MLECATSFATSFAQSKNWIGNKYQLCWHWPWEVVSVESVHLRFISVANASGECWKYDIEMVKCKRSNILIQLFNYVESKQHWQWPVGTDPGIEKRSFIESAHLSIPIWRQCWTPTPRWAILWTIWNLSGQLSARAIWTFWYGPGIWLPGGKRCLTYCCRYDDDASSDIAAQKFGMGEELWEETYGTPYRPNCILLKEPLWACKIWAKLWKRLIMGEQ